MVEQPDDLFGPYTLHELDAMVSANDPELQALVQVAAKVCGVPIALVGLVDEARIRIKAQVGLPEIAELAREGAFCTHTLDGSGLLEVPDAAEDARFANSPQVAQMHGVRFYAGVPLILSDGIRVGTLAVIDTRPQRLNEMQRDVLEHLAIAVAHSLEVRRALRIEERARGIEEAAQALRKSEDLLQRIGKITGIGGWEMTFDPETRAFLSDTCCAIHGLPVGSVLSQAQAISFYAPESQAAVKAALTAAIENGGDFGFEAAFIRADGQRIWVSAQGYVETDQGIAVRATGTLQDISAQIAQRNEVLDARERIALAVDTGRIGIWDCELSSNLVTCNDWMAEMFGFVPGYAAPRIEQWVARIHPEDRPRVEADLRHAQETGATFLFEFRVQQPAGGFKYIRASARIVHDAEGRATHLLGTDFDVTDLRETAIELTKQKDLVEEAQRRIAVAVDTGRIGFWDGELATGIVTCNRWMQEMFGFADNQGGKSISDWMDCVVAEDRPLVDRMIQSATNERASLYYEYRVRKPNGSVGHIRSSVQAHFSSEGVPLRVYGANIDVTDLRQLTAELTKQHELLHVTLQSIGDAVITTDIDGRVNWLNPVAERMTGWMTGEARGLPLQKVFHIVNEETRLPTENPVETCLLQGKVVGLANHTLLISRHGEEFGIEDSAAPIRSETGELLGVVLVFHDVTEQRRLSGEMTYRATHDPLTGLVNRSEFDARLRRLLNRAHEDHSEHALLYIDLDQFKLINDTCGHYVGDQMLQQVGKLLGETVRSRDTLARLGGDEFAVILEYCSAEMALRVAQDICRRMDDFRLQHGDRRFRIGTSIGLVPVDNRWPNTVAILQAADKSCYAAKDAGRNRVHIWSDSDLAMRVRHGEIQWTTRIEQALDEDRFVLFAQRIEPLKDTGRGIHAEVLLRLIDADGSVVPPGAFMPAAERYNLASRIDRWVLRRALDWLIEHRGSVLIDTLCVNLSGHSLGDHEFHRHLVDTLNVISPEIRQQFCFEITETAAVTNLADASRFMDEVRALGVRFALDDFGAGASSFGYLKALQVDYLKIDGQFIRNLTSDPLDDAAVRCFVDVARVVKVKTVAEFVDSPAVLARLREIGVDSAQGFLLHRPAPIEELLEHGTVSPT